jgi:hypothetical protein
VKTLYMLLDMFALAARTGDDARNMTLSLHGDVAVAAVRAWASDRGVAALPPQERSDKVSGHRWTTDRVLLDNEASIDAYSDWRTPDAPPATERQVIPVIATPGGAS